MSNSYIAAEVSDVQPAWYNKIINIINWSNTSQILLFRAVV